MAKLPDVPRELPGIRSEVAVQRARFGRPGRSRFPLIDSPIARGFFSGDERKRELRQRRFLSPRRMLGLLTRPDGGMATRGGKRVYPSFDLKVRSPGL